MTKLIKLELENENSIYVEATSDTLDFGGGEVLASPAEQVTKLKEALSPVSGVINAAIESIKEVATSPDTIEIEFGLKFSADANVIVSKASAEATLKIKAVWKNTAK